MAKKNGSKNTATETTTVSEDAMNTNEVLENADTVTETVAARKADPKNPQVDDVFSAVVSTKKVNVKVLNISAEGYRCLNMNTDRYITIKDKASFGTALASEEQGTSGTERSRLSPRVKAYNDILAMLATHPALTGEALVAKLQEMRDAAPETATEAKHFVVVGPDGTRSALTLSATPSKSDTVVSAYYFEFKKAAEMFAKDVRLPLPEAYRAV